MYIAMAAAICSLGQGLCFIVVHRSTQPCIPSGPLHRVPASAVVRAGCHIAGWQVTQCDRIWHVKVAITLLYYDTIRYDTIRDAILTCARKPT